MGRMRFEPRGGRRSTVGAVIALIALGWAGLPAAASDPVPKEDATPDPSQVEVSAEEEARRKELVTVPDEKEADNPLTFSVFGRPLTVSTSLKSRLDFEVNPALDMYPDDRVRIREEVGLDLYYQITQTISIFLEGKYRYRWDIYREGGGEKNNGEFRRGQTFVNADHLFGSSFGFRIGRQLFDDMRSWWWSEKMDAARVFFDSELFYADVAYAEEVLPNSSDDDFLDPDDEDVRRILGHARWEYLPKHHAEIFVLHQDDYSDSHSVGEVVSEDTEDDLDGDLTWVGLRGHGQWRVRHVGKFYYWLDGALVAGDETETEYDSIGSGDSVVDSVTDRDILGFGFDTGVTWATRWPCEPAITLQYAFGSGDGGSSGTDNSFRQTDLQINKDRLRGESRVNYYGRALDPELSNLHIVTLGLGFPLFESSYIEFLYHYYHQVERSDRLRSEGIYVDPDGGSGSIGNGFDAVLSIDEWEHVEIDVAGSAFRAGSAFGSEQGVWAWRGIFELEIAF
jgi:hypothetical protein